MIIMKIPEVILGFFWSTQKNVHYLCVLFLCRLFSPEKQKGRMISIVLFSFIPVTHPRGEHWSGTRFHKCMLIGGRVFLIFKIFLKKFYNSFKFTEILET